MTEMLLQGIPHVIVRFNNILVTGKTRDNHLGHLKEVLAQLAKAGICPKLKKCFLLQTQVIYLGHSINKEGIQPLESKVRVIQEPLPPSNVKKCQVFLGMLSYRAWYLPNL